MLMRNIVNRALERAKTKQISLLTLLLLFTMGIGQMWAQDVTLADINYTQWDGTAMPTNSGLSNSNTYYASDGTNRIVTLVGKGCKLDDSNNAPTATGISGSYEHYLRFGSSGNYLNITASNDLVKNAGETSYGKIRFLVSSQKNKTTDELAEITIGETSLGKIYAFTSTSTCDWVEFDIPATVSKNATITLTRTTNTLFVWGIQIKTFSSGGGDTPSTYTVTLNPNEGGYASTPDGWTADGSNIKKTVSAGALTIPAPARASYDFDGWKSGEDDVTLTDGKLTVSKDTTLTAQWTESTGGDPDPGSDPEPTVTCPESGVLFSADAKTTSDKKFSTGTTEITSSDVDITGGAVYAISGQSDQKVLLTKNGQFSMTNNNTIFKFELDCALAAGDKITIDGQGGVKNSVNKGLWITSTEDRPSSAPACAGDNGTDGWYEPILSYVVTSTDEYVGKTTLFVHRPAGATQNFDNVVITRPYDVSFVSSKGTAPTTPTKAVELTLAQITGVDGWIHTGWTADVAVKVGGETKTAGTALAVDATVLLSANTTFTATWEANVTKHTVTYYDGEAIEANKLGSELVVEGENPTGAGLAPTKFKYTFGGWSTTNGGAAVALNTITVAADKDLFVVWTPKVCPTSGEIYSLVADPTKAPGSNTYYPTTKPGVADLAIYATVSGGLAQSIQTTSSNNSVQIQSSTAAMKITADNSIVRALLECPLQEGDTIKLVKDNKLKITFDSVATSAKTIQLANGVGENKDYYVVEAKFAGMDTIHVRKDGSNVSLTSLKVIRPAKYAVTFNMHGHGDQVAQQDILAGGKVTEPADPTAEGYDFDGWFKTYVAEPESYSDAWDFDNDVVSAATEIHAKWVTHVAKYGVKFMDGTTKLDSLSVTLGEAPSFANPTKALYAFAGWKDGEDNDVTLSDLATSVTVEDTELVLYAQWTKLYAQSVDFSTFLLEDERLNKTLAQVLAENNLNYACGGTFSKSEWGQLNGEEAAFHGYKFKDKNVYIEFRVPANQRATILFGNYGATGKIKIGDADAVDCILTDSKYVIDAVSETVVRFTTNTGSGSTVTLKSITIGDIPELSDDATLSDLKVGGTTIAGFAANKYDYYYELPYGSTSQPEVTATKNHAKASAVVSQTLASLDDAVVTVTAEDLSYKTYTVHFTCAPKLGVEVFAYTPVGSNGEKEATGYKGGIADINLQTAKTGDGYKLGSNGHYIGIIVDGGLKANDLICINIADLQGASALTFYDGKGDGKSLVITPAPTPKLGNNYVTVPSDIDQIYLYRADGTCNPSVKSVAVYREMASFFESFTVAGVAGTIDETVSPKTITVEVPAVTDITALTPTYKAWANGGATVSPTTAQDFSEGAIDYTVTSAYEETTTYKVTVTKAAAIKEIVISGTLTVKEDETTALSAVVYDTNDQEAAIQDVTWSVKAGDESLAEVDENGVVTGKAVGTAHIIATSVADNTISAQVEVAVIENPCRTWNAPTSSWSDAVVTVGKLQIARGDCPASSEMTPYSGASKCYGIKVDGSGKFIELTMSDGAQFESLTLGASSGSNGSSPKYVVVASSATTFASSAVLSAVEYVANAKDAEQSLNVIDLPTGTRNVRLYRSYDDKGDGTSVYLYYVAACKKEFVPVEAVAVADGNLAIGKSLTLSATTTPANADIASFVWSIESMTATGVTIEGNVLTAADNATEGEVVVKVVATDVLSNVKQATATITVINHFDEIKLVTGTTTWNWEELTVPSGDGPKIAANDTVLANYLSGAEWERIAGAYNEYVYRSNSEKYYQGTKLNIKTTVPGVLSIKARRANSGDELYVNGDKVADLITDMITYKVAVPAGDVKITGDAKMRVAWMKFQTLDEATPDHDRISLTIDKMITVCVDHNVPAGCFIGGEAYELLCWKYGTSYADCQMVDFGSVDEMVAGHAYMVIPTEATFKLFYGANEADAPVNVRGFIGSFTGIDGTQDPEALHGMYGITNNHIQKLGTGCTLQANRAYIDLSQTPSKEEYEASQNANPAPRKRVSLGRTGENSTTGFGEIETSEAPVKMMIDGQLFILRGEKMYDATGRLVK